MARVARSLPDHLPDLPEALCRVDRGADPKLWQPVYGTTQKEAEVLASQAKVVCFACGERAKCLEFAVRNIGRVEGVWGGVVFSTRRA